MSDIAETIVAGILVAVIFAVVVLIYVMIGSVFGAFAGWVLGFTQIGTWILNFMESIGIKTNMVELGATAGFIGGFFGHSASGSKS